MGFCVVSGLARGIDGASHRGALDAKGLTVAVLGHGLDRIYPASNAALGREILGNGGCLLSEYPPGVPPLKHHFPQTKPHRLRPLSRNIGYRGRRAQRFSDHGSTRLGTESRSLRRSRPLRRQRLQTEATDRSKRARNWFFLPRIS